MCVDEEVGVFGFSGIKQRGTMVITETGCLILPDDVTYDMEVDNVVIPFTLNHRKIEDEAIYRYIDQFKEKKLEFLYHETKNLYVANICQEGLF